MFSDEASKPACGAQEWNTLRHNLLLLAGDAAQSDGYLIVAQKLAECMQKMDERFDDWNDVGREGRSVCEHAASFFKAVSTSRSPLEGPSLGLKKELNELATLARPDWAKDVHVLERPAEDGS